VKVILRGDCCPRRGIAMNADLFGGRPTIVKNEKSRTDFLVDHDRTGSPTAEDVERLFDLDAMSKSLRAYTIQQTERDTLAVTDADLIVIDNYADMNFSAWRHRTLEWKLWIHPRFLRDPDGFREQFEELGQLSFDESLEYHVALIERYRERNGSIPVLYMHQPVALYRKLHERRDFDRLGPALEQRVEGVFSGAVDDAALEPADMDSCGPGQTLHFQGPTYRRMIEQAMQKGLGAWLPIRTASPH
jgi:hypothetical protein